MIVKGLLKVLSILEIIIGILSIAGAVLYFTGSGLAEQVTETTAEQGLVINFTVEGVLLAIAGVFNLACGVCGIRGANGNIKSISHAVKLGVIGFIVAAISAFMLVYGQASVAHIVTAISSSVIPVLFLISAMSVKSKLK